MPAFAMIREARAVTLKAFIQHLYMIHIMLALTRPYSTSQPMLLEVDTGILSVLVPWLKAHLNLGPSTHPTRLYLTPDVTGVTS
jgi:hypothetical protein